MAGRLQYNTKLLLELVTQIKVSSVKCFSMNVNKKGGHFHFFLSILILRGFISPLLLEISEILSTFTRQKIGSGYMEKMVRTA